MDELSNDFDLEIMQNASWNLDYEDDFNETADNFGNGTNSNATIDCGVLDEDYIRVWSSFQWWLEGVGFTGLGIAGTYFICVFFELHSNLLNFLAPKKFRKCCVLLKLLQSPHK